MAPPSRITPFLIIPPRTRHYSCRHMTEKAAIIAEIGEQAVLLPALVQQALLANDRIKYFFSLLQTAGQRAEQPGQTPSNLRAEREAANIEDQSLDSIVAGTVRVEDGSYRVPHLDRVMGEMRRATDEMVRPFLAAGLAGGEAFQARARRLLDGITTDGEQITGTEIGAITSGERGARDSLHLLVMDLHRGLNDLLAALANESIDGAQAYMLDDDDDRDLVRAFMRGLNRTARLKFDHPGLGTTATRSGDRLVIQNDIGVTDAHVLVVAVTGSAVSITYTDVHMPRLTFFQSLFDEWEVEWSDTLSRRPGGLKSAGIYHLTTGVYRGNGAGDAATFLAHLGSRLVFLIDWNKARKQLRNFLLNKDAIAVIRRAANEEIGHRGFLVLGGSRLIYGALDLAARVPLRYGEPLHQVLGREKTMEYLSWTLRTASRGLLEGTPRMLLQDQIRTELLRYFRSAHAELLDRCLEHATHLYDVAAASQNSLIALRSAEGTDRVARNARRAKAWEHEADMIVSDVRRFSRRIPDVGFFVDLITAQDDALDYLEEGCFFSTILPAGVTAPGSLSSLEEMAGLSVEAVREFIRTLSAAKYIRAGSTRDEMQDFLAAANRVIELEQECDDAWRRTQLQVVEESAHPGFLQVSTTLSLMLEESINSLMKAVWVLHDNFLEEVAR